MERLPAQTMESIGQLFPVMVKSGSFRVSIVEEKCWHVTAKRLTRKEAWLCRGQKERSIEMVYEVYEGEAFKTINQMPEPQVQTFKAQLLNVIEMFTDKRLSLGDLDEDQVLWSSKK
eukprot:TRINITY_DN16272_c0_g1_i1.p2 TRINITY_DN16272_c0_g1~~TRINITY_DN16272_c0_g1_i1.p2  ORF type:complete len:117 (+),score=21.59 TRINITY_DN16272_c0_g1_i1:422-772(+)